VAARRLADQCDARASREVNPHGLANLQIAQSELLAGTYVSTDAARCDPENRLFTNLGSANFPRAVRSIRFERGLGPPPPAPTPVSSAGGHVYYYRYRPGGVWGSWEPATLVARWHRIARRVAGDGSCRPTWLAMKSAGIAGQVEVLTPPLDAATPFGVRLLVHATPRGPRHAAAISETLIDGVIAALHAGATSREAVTIAAALAPSLPGTSISDLAALASASAPGPLFDQHPFVVSGSYIQINPHDELCHAGEVAIQADAEGQFPQISGELFTLRQIGGSSRSNRGRSPTTSSSTARSPSISRTSRAG
jgi:hypothetical protein